VPPYRVYLTAPSGTPDWTHLSVPAGREFGMAQFVPADWRWLSTLEYETSDSFEYQPFCNGVLHCRCERDDAWRGDFDEIVPRDFYHMPKTQSPAFLRHVIAGEFDQLSPLVVSSAAANAIRTLQGSVSLVITPHGTVDLPDGSGIISHLVYDSVDIAALRSHFVPLASGPLKTSRHLLSARNGRPALTEDQVFQMFLLGLISPNVDATKHKLGAPAIISAGSSSGKRRIAIRTYTYQGPTDPIVLLDRMNVRGDLEDPHGFLSSPAVATQFYWDQPHAYQDNRLDMGAALSVNSLKSLATRYMYPYSMLRITASRLGIATTSTEWDAIRLSQKQLYKTILTAWKAGTVTPGFQWEDRRNPIQLEAIIEFFCVGRTGTPATDQPVTVDFRAKESFTAAKLTAAPSDLYLVQIFEMNALGGPFTHLAISTNSSATGLPTDFPTADKYEGVMFLVYGGDITDLFYGFSSLTSSVNTDEDALSSIEGNRKYRFRSRASPSKKSHNYAFGVTLNENLDGMEGLSGYYFWGARSLSSPISKGSVDADGKSWIVIHRGNEPIESNADEGNWSHGCQVAPALTYYRLRDRIVEDWLTDHPEDKYLRFVQTLTQPESEKVYDATLKTHEAWEKKLSEEDGPDDSEQLTEKEKELIATGRILPDVYWNNRIIGTYFLVRPTEVSVLGFWKEIR
jgi:hypothetical protein